MHAESKILKKLKQRSGFTLGEILVTVLIMLMAASIIVAGVPAAGTGLPQCLDKAGTGRRGARQDPDRRQAGQGRAGCRQGPAASFS